MRTERDLGSDLARIDGKGYRAYRDIQGEYDMGEYTLSIDHVQGDPFAAPSRIRVFVDMEAAAFPDDTYNNLSREIALRDLLTRHFSMNARGAGGKSRGMGKSGLIGMDTPGQEVLERTSILVSGSHIEARFLMGLPAFGRRIAGRQAAEMFLKDLPMIVRNSLFFKSLDRKEIYDHIQQNEDSGHIRSLLGKKDLIAFVANESILPRRSGIDDRQMGGDDVVPFLSPPDLEVTLNTPNRGDITGMGIPRGITLIVGGGYHGKSTLLSAIELGIYDHILGDGRELVITDPSAVKIRAEDGRRVENVDISPFISDLPLGKDTGSFSTEDASGSTSQAANIIEALEAGAGTLLIDEDTSATNFMIRDHRMQELVTKDKEPITPFIDRVRQLHDELAVSTILVIGGSGDYFDVADLVICMEGYVPMNRTSEAREIAERYRAERVTEGKGTISPITPRIPIPSSFDPSRGRRDVKITTRDISTISFGNDTIDLSRIEQMVHRSQTKAIGDAIHRATMMMDGKRTLKEVLDELDDRLDEGGLDALGGPPSGDRAYFRSLELACAINRLRTLEMKQRR
ncbi:MAG: ABC-ATPase domain-containing protein [Thermoplasmata archaeon]|nr:ABC-ATPase domain-containing protein [Thermoplasmata archaeon]